MLSNGHRINSRKVLNGGKKSRILCFDHSENSKEHNLFLVTIITLSDNTILDSLVSSKTYIAFHSQQETKSSKWLQMLAYVSNKSPKMIKKIGLSQPTNFKMYLLFLNPLY